MASAELRPMGLGELLDRAVTLAVGNLGRLLAAVGLPYLPLALAQWALLGEFYADKPARAITPSAWSALWITLLLGLVVSAYTRTAAAVIAYGAYTARPVPLSRAFGTALARFPAVLALYLVTALCYAALAIVLFFPAFVVGAIVAAAGASIGATVAIALVAAVSLGAPFLLWLTLGFEIATIRVARGASGFSALFSALTATAFRRPWRSLLAALVALLLTTAVALVLSLASDSLPSVALRVFVGFGLGTVATVLGEVLTVAFLVVYDVDLAVRHEGYDLALTLEELAPGNAGAGTPRA